MAEVVPPDVAAHMRALLAKTGYTLEGDVTVQLAGSDTRGDPAGVTLGYAATY